MRGLWLITGLTLLLPGPVHAAQQAADTVVAAAQAEARRDGRRPLHDFAGSVKALGRDFWYAFSAPVRMDSHAWLVTGGVLAAGGLLVLADEEIMRAALRNREEPVFKQIDEVGTFLEPVGLMGNTNVWYASAAMLSYAVGWERPNRMFTELLYSHWIAGVIRGGAVKLVGRSRPYSGAGAYKFKIGRGTSFPSGHASTAIQVATVLSHHIGSMPMSVLLYGLAGAAAWQRVTSEQHWASDVWLGAAYGWAVAKLVIWLHEDDALRIEPAMVPSGTFGLGLRYRF